MKPQPVKVPSDDCIVWVGRVISDGAITEPGQPYAVHEGEWVKITPVSSIASLDLLTDIRNLQSRVDAVDDSESAVQAQFERLDIASTAYGGVCDQLAERLVEWNWTDMKDNVLPQPSAEVLRRLTPDELLYLLGVVSGSNPSAEKKDSRPSESTSGATPSRAARRSATGRSPSRV